MKVCFFIFTFVVLLGQPISGQIVDPVAHFINTSNDPSSKLIKWTADLDGDGKLEVFLSNKDDYNSDVSNNLPAGWFAFFASQTDNSFIESSGIQKAGENNLGVGGLAEIDIKVCFVGTITELGQRGIITMRVDNPRSGESIARIYAYTIDGDHLKRTDLAEYNITEANALFDKYLRSSKRTVITPIELTR